MTHPQGARADAARAAVDALLDRLARLVADDLAGPGPAGQPDGPAEPTDPATLPSL